MENVKYQYLADLTPLPPEARLASKAPALRESIQLLLAQRLQRPEEEKNRDHSR
ncbi:hypothetical protein IV102_37885 [bacterium]|nr:hypothetical protein [bacterium]